MTKSTNFKKLYSQHVQEQFFMKQRVGTIEVEKLSRLTDIEKEQDEFMRKYRSYLSPRREQSDIGSKKSGVAAPVPNPRGGRRQSICFGEVNRVTKECSVVSPADFPYSFDSWNTMVTSRVKSNVEKIDLDVTSRLKKSYSCENLSKTTKSVKEYVQEKDRPDLTSQIKKDTDSSSTSFSSISDLSLGSKVSANESDSLPPLKNCNENVNKGQIGKRRNSLAPNMFSSIPRKFPSIYKAMTDQGNSLQTRQRQNNIAPTQSVHKKSSSMEEISVRLMIDKAKGAKKFKYLSKLVSIGLRGARDPTEKDVCPLEKSDLVDCRYLRMPSTDATCNQDLYTM